MLQKIQERETLQKMSGKSKDQLNISQIIKAINAKNIRTETSLLDWFSFFGGLWKDSDGLFNDSFSSELDSDSASSVIVMP